MARRKKRRTKKYNEPLLEIAPETKRGILVIFFFAVAAILLLAFFELAGSAGRLLVEWLAAALGSAAAVTPLLFAALGALLLVPSGNIKKGAGVLGLILFLFALTGLFDVWAEFFPSTISNGGILGSSASGPLVRAFGKWSALIIWLALLLASVLLTLNTSIEALAKHGKGPFVFLSGLFSRKTAEPKVLEGGEPVISENGSAEPTFLMRELPWKKTKQKKQNEESREPEPHAEFQRGLKSRTRKKIDLPLDLLNHKGSKPTSGDIKRAMEIIEKTLSQFGIPVQMGDVSVGPTVTQYTFRPQEGIKLTKITALKNDLALALAAHPIRIEAPIPGKSLVGIEVPNQIAAIVGLRELLESQTFAGRPSNLMLALGKDVAGHPWFAELPKLPHMLVAGATGSGKTVCLNTIIVSLLYQNSPDELKLILIDPKRVELPVYNGIPHLLVPTITDVHKTINALKWAISEMERRFRALETAGARDIQNFNAQAEETMPSVVIVVDELADLMAAAPSDVEAGIIRIAQMARAVGIHLIVATQRPSVDVITGLIKANIPARAAFAVASQTDSRTILDTSGAESLLGRGDMLFISPELSKPRRLQGAFVSDDEIKRVVRHLKTEYEAPSYDPTITEKQQSSVTTFSDGGDEEDDPLLPEAKDVILQAGKASASLLQRRLKVGYARAARLLDLLEAQGFIGPADGAKPREVLNARRTASSSTYQTGAAATPPPAPPYQGGEDEEMPPWE